MVYYSGMPKEIATHQFPKHSAGSIMTTAVPTVRAGKTVGDIEALLLKHAYEFATINYIYVLDEHRKLAGVLSIKDVFSHDKKTIVKELMETKVVSVRAHTHQERTALLAVHHSVKAMPVVDHDNKFLGVVPSDTILKILHSEHIEDVLKGVGVVVEKGAVRDALAGSITTQVRRRLPWLIFGLVGGMAAAALVRSFEEALTAQVLLVAFIPTVVYMAGAVGTQVETIFVRRLAIDEDLKIWSYVRRELVVGVSLALILGIIISLVSVIWLGSMVVGLILSLSFVAAIMAATGIALALPSIFRLFRVDPAVASGPFATVISDLVSLLIYFGVAQVILKTMVAG